MKFLAIAIFSLAFSCLLSFTLGKVDRYKIAIKERGARFTEEIEIDEQRNYEVFRVPPHNDVNGADFYHDFKMRLTVTKIPSQKVCYVAEMDSSLSSPGRLKADIKRAASQPGKLPVITEPYVVLVTGPADKLLLTKEILEFCGPLPIFNTELISADTGSGNGTAIIRTRRLKRSRTHSIIIRKFERSCKSMKTVKSGQNGNNGYDFSDLNNCRKNGDVWDLSCKMKPGTCFYFVTCKKRVGYDWKCNEVHSPSAIPACCDYICRT